MATINPNTITTEGALTFVRDDRRTIVTREGYGVVGRIEVNGAAFVATLYGHLASEAHTVRFVSTHRHGVALFKYGF